MNEYDNSGTLSRNERQRPNHRDPEYSGQVKINGVEYWLSGWAKQGRNGGKFMSLAFKPKNVEKPQPAQQESQPDDGLPF